MLNSFFRRHRRFRERLETTNYVDMSNDIESQLEARHDQQGGTHSQRALLLMAQNHMLAFVVVMYSIYLFCRLLGWNPGTKSKTYTFYFEKDS